MCVCGPSFGVVVYCGHCGHMCTVVIMVICQYVQVHQSLKCQYMDVEKLNNDPNAHLQLEKECTIEHLHIRICPMLWRHSPIPVQCLSNRFWYWNVALLSKIQRAVAMTRLSLCYVVCSPVQQ